MTLNEDIFFLNYFKINLILLQQTIENYEKKLTFREKNFLLSYLAENFAL